MGTREKITVATKKDFDVSYFCGPGAGGQARNKVASGVQIIHTESGAIGRSSDTRSQHQNKRSALEKLVKTPKFKFWLNKKLFELREKETVEESVERELQDPSKVKVEVRVDGKWTEVSQEYFNNLKDEPIL